MFTLFRQLLTRLRRALFGAPAHLSRIKTDPRFMVDTKKINNSPRDDAGR